MLRPFLYLLLWIPCTLAGQNLVKNPEFEQHTSCPDRPGQINLALYWYSPSTATPDYFNDCSPGIDYGTEFNKKGGQLPHSGHAYAGMQFYYLNHNEYYEYIQTALDTALTPGQLYCISLFTSMGTARYALKHLDAVLSVTEVKNHSAGRMILPCTELGNGQMLTDQDQWMCLHGIYKAKGGERFLTLGCFSPGDSFWHIKTGTQPDSLFKSTYYFVDDVALTAIQDSAACKCLTK